jgi:hypothetical protein
VAGLLGPGDRKSMQPISRRLGLGTHDRLHHFVSDGIWDAKRPEAELMIQANRRGGGSEACLVIERRRRTVGLLYIEPELLTVPTHSPAAKIALVGSEDT